jgi:hypothetical protein
MIISTSISNRVKVHIGIMAAVCAGLSLGGTTAAAAPKPMAISAKAMLQASFEKAILGKGNGPAVGVLRSRGYGMACTPRLSSAQPKLVIDLPSPAAQRRHVFAVISPDGRLYEIYTPYSDDVETADIIIPSETISWQKARSRSRFTLSASELTALSPGKQTPERVFTAKGRYKFALVNSIQKDLIAVSDTPGRITVHAGCIIDWTP